jgi:bile acid:Na+ symporter, BASS family
LAGLATTSLTTLVPVVLLPGSLAIVLFGLGLGLTLADFKRIFVTPKAVIVGLILQTVVLTALCAGIALMLNLPPDLAIGMMLLAASPGGVSANIFSHLAHGDVALNITLTAINSVLALVTLPLIVTFSLLVFAGNAVDIPTPFHKIVEVALIVLIPLALGMLVRARALRFAIIAEPYVRFISAAVLVILSVASLWQSESTLTQQGDRIILACVLFNVISMIIGYVTPRFLGLDRAQATAIAMEIGIHNAALAIFIALQVLKNPIYAVPAAIYSFVMAITAGAFTVWTIWQRRQTSNALSSAADRVQQHIKPR